MSIQKIAAAERGEFVHVHDRGVLERFYTARLRDELGDGEAGAKLGIIKRPSDKPDGGVE